MEQRNRDLRIQITRHSRAGKTVQIPTAGAKTVPSGKIRTDFDGGSKPPPYGASFSFFEFSIIYIILLFIKFHEVFMSARKKAMGRGLDALFESNSRDESGISVLPISDIEPNRGQPRKQFDEKAIEELAESVKIHGIIQPIIVRSAGDGFYVIVAGERRYRAAKLAGLTEVPVLITELSSSEAAEVALVENLQRADLNPIEVAEAYKALTDDFSLTQQQLAERIGKPRSSVANALRLLELPEKVKKYIAEGKLSDGHSKVIAGLGDEALMIQAADEAVRDGLSVRSTELLVKRLKAPKKIKVEDPQKQSYDRALSERMFSILGRKVTVNKGKKHTLEISYTDSDDLESLIKRICGDDVFDF